jgi:hypothetical protein
VGVVRGIAIGSERATDLSAGVAVSAPAARKTSQNRTAQNLPPQTDTDRPEWLTAGQKQPRSSREKRGRHF